MLQTSISTSVLPPPPIRAPVQEILPGSGIAIETIGSKVYVHATSGDGGGSQGPQGIPGPSGEQGLKGDQGDIGLQGIQGPSGLQGVEGIAGPSGAQGIQGLTGPSGAQGLQGITGPSGSQGVQGIIGPSGTQGIQGIQGIAGPSGATGLIGPQGDQGIQGIPGPSGATGPSGAQGIQGIQGPASVVDLTGSGFATVLQMATSGYARQVDILPGSGVRSVVVQTGRVYINASGGAYVRHTGFDLPWNATSLQNVSGLEYPIGPGEVIVGEAIIFCSASNAATGVGLSLNGPASPVFVRFGAVIPLTTGTFFEGGATAFETKVQAATGVNTVLMARMSFHVINGPNAGVLVPRICSEGTTIVTAHKGSWATYMRV